MHRSILTCVFMAAVCASLTAQQQNPPQTDPQSPQQSSPSDPYQGVSSPPSDDTIQATQTDEPAPPPAKPRAGKLLIPPAPAAPAPAPPAQVQQPQPASIDPGTAANDDGIVQIAAPAAVPPAGFDARENADPDGDIVHVGAATPGELSPGAMIRVRLLTRLSTSESQRGDEFRARVASDVLQDDRVLIPTGAEIDGRVVQVSGGTPGGHGVMRLRPDWVVLPDGSRYRLDAQVTGTPGSNTHVGSEGAIEGGSRFKKDGLEYGGGVGAGVVTGALVGGPVGALAGGIIGGSAITVHLLMDHPQAVLDPGSVLIFSLNSRLNLQAPDTSAN